VKSKGLAPAPPVLSEVEGVAGVIKMVYRNKFSKIFPFFFELLKTALVLIRENKKILLLKRNTIRKGDAKTLSAALPYFIEA
jgi:hypothetical protein